MSYSFVFLFLIFESLLYFIFTSLKYIDISLSLSDFHINILVYFYLSFFHMRLLEYIVVFYVYYKSISLGFWCGPAVLHFSYYLLAYLPTSPGYFYRSSPPLGSFVQKWMIENAWGDGKHECMNDSSCNGGSRDAKECLKQRNMLV